MIDHVNGWSALFFLGALHGVNPGMGWLFAVGLGIQNGSGWAVWRSLPFLMIGHLAAIGVALVAGVLLGATVNGTALRLIVAGLLFGLGILHLRRHRHPRYGGMQVKSRDLVVWSFLVATTHGAGLMALPFIPSNQGIEASAMSLSLPHDGHTHALIALPPGSDELDEESILSRANSGKKLRVMTVATLIHTVGYLLATGLIASLIYYRWGIAIIRKAWFNLDVVWAGGLVLTAIFILVS